MEHRSEGKTPVEKLACCWGVDETSLTDILREIVVEAAITAALPIASAERHNPATTTYKSLAQRLT